MEQRNSAAMVGPSALQLGILQLVCIVGTEHSVTHAAARSHHWE